MEHEDAVTIRTVEPGDVDAIIAITAEVFGPVSIDGLIEKMMGRPAADWVTVKAQAIRRELADNPRGCFVAESDGKVVGYVTTAIDEAASRGVIANLAVSSACQNRGVGRALLGRALEDFRRRGLAQAKIETLACNAAGQHLYRAMGFREVVRQIHYVMELKKHGQT